MCACVVMHEMNAAVSAEQRQTSYSKNINVTIKVVKRPRTVILARGRSLNESRCRDEGG